MEGGGFRGELAAAGGRRGATLRAVSDTKLAALVRQYEAEIVRLRAERAVHHAHVRRADMRIRAIAKTVKALRRASGELEESTLTDQSMSVTVNGVERTDEHRRKLSVSHRAPTDDFTKAFQKAGYPSLRALAKRLEVDVGFLSRIRKGTQPMPERLAVEIERLTAYPASRWRR